ncbi:MAG: hypothetical protein ABII23_01330 [bacterium]
MKKYTVIILSICLINASLPAQAIADMFLAPPGLSEAPTISHQEFVDRLFADGEILADFLEMLYENYTELYTLLIERFELQQEIKRLGEKKPKAVRPGTQAEFAFIRERRKIIESSRSLTRALSLELQNKIKAIDELLRKTRSQVQKFRQVHIQSKVLDWYEAYRGTMFDLIVYVDECNKSETLSPDVLKTCRDRVGKTINNVLYERMLLLEPQGHNNTVTGRVSIKREKGKILVSTVYHVKKPGIQAGYERKVKKVSYDFLWDALNASYRETESETKEMAWLIELMHEIEGIAEDLEAYEIDPSLMSDETHAAIERRITGIIHKLEQARVDEKIFAKKVLQSIVRIFKIRKIKVIRSLLSKVQTLCLIRRSNVERMVANVQSGRIRGLRDMAKDRNEEIRTKKVDVVIKHLNRGTDEWALKTLRGLMRMKWLEEPEYKGLRNILKDAEQKILQLPELQKTDPPKYASHLASIRDTLAIVHERADLSDILINFMEDYREVYDQWLFGKKPEFTSPREVFESVFNEYLVLSDRIKSKRGRAAACDMVGKNRHAFWTRFYQAAFISRKNPAFQAVSDMWLIQHIQQLNKLPKNIRKILQINDDNADSYFQCGLHERKVIPQALIVHYKLNAENQELFAGAILEPRDSSAPPKTTSVVSAIIGWLSFLLISAQQVLGFQDDKIMTVQSALKKEWSWDKIAIVTGLFSFCGALIYLVLQGKIFPNARRKAELVHSLREFADLLAPEARDIVLNPDLNPHDFSNNINNPIRIRNHVPPTIVIKGKTAEDIIDAMGLKLDYPEDRRVRTIVFSSGKYSNALTILIGSQKKHFRRILRDKMALGRVFYREQEDPSRHRRIGDELIKDCFYLAQAADKTNPYWSGSLDDGACTIIVAKKGADKEKVIGKWAVSLALAGILGKEYCALPGIGMSSVDTSLVADQVFETAIVQYLENPLRERKLLPGIITVIKKWKTLHTKGKLAHSIVNVIQKWKEANAETKLLEGIMERCSWDDLNKYNINLGISLPAAGRLIEDSQIAGLHTELQAVSAVTVFEAIAASKPLQEKLYGKKLQNFKVHLQGFGHMGSAVGDVLSSKAVNLPSMDIVGIDDGSGSIYNSKGVSSRKISRMRQKILAGETINFTKEFKPDQGLVPPSDTRQTILSSENRADVFVNATRFDYLTMDMLSTLHEAGVHVLIDMCETNVSKEMREFLHNHDMLFIPSIFMTGTDSYIAMMQIYHEYWGGKDQRETRYLLHYIMDVMHERASVYIDILLKKLIKSKYRLSVTGYMQEQVKHIREHQEELYTDLENHVFPEIQSYIVDHLKIPKSREEIKKAALLLERYVSRHKKLHKAHFRDVKSVLEQIVSFMKSGISFKYALMHASIRFAARKILYEEKEPYDYLVQLEEADSPNERVIAAHHLATQGIADDAIIRVLLEVKKTDKNPQVRTTCLRALSVLGLKAEVPKKQKETIIESALLSLRDSDDNVRYAARRALHHLGFSGDHADAQIAGLRQTSEKIMAEPLDIQIKNLRLGECHAQIAALFDFKYDLNQAQEYYKKAQTYYHQSKIGGPLTYDIQLRRARIMVREGDFKHAIEEFLRLIDPVEVGRLFDLKKFEHAAVLKDDIDVAKFMSLETRREALIDIFKLFFNYYRIAIDMGNGLEEILKVIDEMDDFNNPTLSRKEKISLIKSMLPIDYTDPNFKLLAVYGTEIYHDPNDKSARRIKEAVKYMLVNRLLVTRSGEEIEKSAVSKILYSKREPFRRLKKSDRQEIIEMLEILDIIADSSNSSVMMTDSPLEFRARASSH